MAKNFSTKNQFVNTKNNYDKAKSYLTTDWDNFLPNEKTSWKDNSIFTDWDNTGIIMFKNYFLKTMVYENDIHYNSVTLGPGTGNFYADRTSRIWSTS